ncbi:phage tail tape measure protein [Parageobacillus thermoglucosidasius]|uniref:Phage tail tape measure protein n=1 Tax=Parageobacillus thermoglucosidasius TaxID=1426 RepID=A0A1B7KWY8_PARTM|nr:phage tail tape measure protein [Parageobacillus thermoglucosidasius]OAT74563.1 phage tail tape measure protein [Parageobacillus thermoglucosidasius]
MAETVRGINVVIGADTTKLSKALSDVNQKSREIQSELRQVDRLLKFDPSNTTLLAQKQQLLSQAVANTTEKLNRLKSVQQQVADQFARGEISEGQYRAFQREIEKTEGQLRSLQSRLEETNGAINKHTTTWGKLQEKLSTVGNNLRDIGQRMQNVGQSMAASFGAATAAIGGALGFAVKKSMDFEAQIDRVGAVAGATPAEIKKLEQAALDLGASTSKSATEVAQGMEIMATMGYNTNQILAAMPGIIAAAEASGEDMAVVADTVSAALNAFGLSADKASKVADILAQAANDSAAGIQDMQYTFKYAAPVAKQLGISLEELAAATEIMANNGIRGEQAGTTLRAALIRLSDPPKEAANTLERLGVKITDANGKMLPFSNIIGQLAEKTKNMSNAQKLAALSTIFGTEAASGMLSVVEAGPQKLDALTKSLQNSAGASQEAAAKMKDNLKGSLEELQGAFETAQITIGNALAPAIEKVAGYIQNLINWFNNLSPSTQQFIATAAAVATVLAGIGTAIGVMLMVVGGAINGFGTLAQTFGKISEAISKAGGMMGLFSKALTFLTGPVGIAIAAIAGLIAVGVLVYKNWDTIKAKAIEIWGAIKDWFSQTLESIKQFFNNAWNNIKSFTSSTWDSIKQTTVNVWNAIKTGVMAIITPFINGIKNLFNGMKDGLQQIFNGLKQFFSGVWQAIKNIFLGAVLLIIDLVTGDFKNLSNDARAIFNNLKNALSSIWNGIKQVFSGAVSAIKGFVSAAWSNIQSTTSSVFNGVRSLASSIWNGIKSAISSAVNTAKSAVSNAFSAMRNAVSSIMSGIKSTITSMWNSAVSFLKGIDLYSIGKNIIQGLARGISSMASAVVEKVKSIANSVTKTIRNILDIHSPSRETEKLGKYTTEGFAKGIESKKKDVEAASKKTAEAAKKAFNEAFAKAQTNFKLGKIDSSQYISELRKIQKEYAKLPEQVRKVQLEIKKIEDQRAKEQAEIAKKQFEDAKKAIEDKKALGQLSLDQELKMWQNLAKKYKAGSKERIEIEKEIVRVKDELLKQQFEKEKEYIDKRKYYNDLSLKEELQLYENYIKKYKAGTEQREYYEREIYRVKKEINDKLLEANNEYAQQVKEINERLQQDELKAKEEYEQKVKEINDRLIAEEQKLTEEYEKAVEDRAKSLYSFAGLFDEFKRKNDVTGQGLLKNLSDQVSAFKDWQSNISSLAARGIDEGLLQELRDMGPKAVDEIAALNSLSDEELNQYVQLWREKNALAKAQAVSELEGMRLETQAKIQQLRATANAELEQVRIEYINKIAQLRAQAAAELEQHKNEWMVKIKEITEGTKSELNLMSASMADIGKNSMQGLIDGLNSMMGPLRKKAQEIADTVRATIQSALDIHSPSRVMMELGKWIPAGLAEGINRNINAVVSATNRMAQATIPSVAGYSGAVVPATATINVPKMVGAKIEQHYHFYSTAPTPSEVARKTRQVSRQLAMEWGL